MKDKGKKANKFQVSSPRAWGCFQGLSWSVSTRPVFPTCVGVFLYGPPPRHPLLRLPHVRGGVSLFVNFAEFLLPSSPRAWGCFLLRDGQPQQAEVFPTCVGVFPFYCSPSFSSTSLPHVRGGVSLYRWLKGERAPSSPRAWGCFYPEKPFEHRDAVFPTCVGVFLVQKLL